MTAGSEFDIINPAYPNKLVTLIDFDNSVSIDKSYFLVDFAFMGRDVAPPLNDRQLIGIDGTLYDLIGATETGYSSPRTRGWQTLAINFASLGSINLSLGCLNDTFDAGPSYCFWDNFRTADVVPTQLPGGIPVVTLPGDFQATAPIPEPSSWALMFIGLMAIALIATRRRKLATIPH